VNIDFKANIDVAGIRIPDSKIAREATELVRDCTKADPAYGAGVAKALGIVPQMIAAE
jgi:hypothetical protein